MATLGEYLQNSNTKLLLHLNGSSTDSSGNGNNGSDSNITYSQANGKFGQGAGFNGSNSYITLPNFSWIDGPFTVNLWAKRDVKNRTDGLLYFGNGNYNNCFLIALLNDVGSNMVQPFWDDSTNLFDLVPSTGLTATDINIWYNIVVTFEKVSSVAYMKTYVNGNLDSSVSKSSPGTANGSDFRYVGAGISSGSTRGNYTDGSIDEVIVENRAWTASEVKKYYTYAKGRFNL